MKAMEAIVLLALIALVAVALGWRFIIVPAARAIQRKSQEHDPWFVLQQDEGSHTYLYLSRNGCEPQQIGEPISLNLPAWEYQDKLESAWIDAEDKAAVKNRRLPR